MLSGKIHPAAGRRSPTKPCGFVLRQANFVCPPKRSASPAGGAPQLAVTADLPAGSELKARFLYGQKVNPLTRLTRNYALRIFVNNRSLVGGGYHLGVSLKIAGNAVFLLNRHLFFTLFDFLVGNLKLDFIFGNVD